MESRFAALRQRDSSVSMLRVKLSRRRSQCQKENRGKAVDSRRQLGKLSELDQSAMMDASSVLTRNMSIIQEKAGNVSKTAKTNAGLDRLKQLERWKERKTLEKEKEKREKERKDIFKTGLYHPKDAFPCVVLPQVPKSKARTKEATVKASHPQTARVTRSGIRQQRTQKPLPPQKEPEPFPAVRKVEPAVGRTTRSRALVTQPAMTRAKATVEPVGCAMSTRSAKGPPVSSVPKAKDKQTADARGIVKQTNIKKAELSSGKASKNKVTFEEQPILPKESDSREPEQEARPAPTPVRMEEEEERMVEEDVTAGPLPVEAPSSFAPQGFMFQAPVGLSHFKFQPLTPRSADSFLRPNSSFTLPPVPSFDFKSQVEPSSFPPQDVPLDPPPHTSPTPAPQQAPLSPQEPEHNVPYFRLQMVLETEKLTGLSQLWESRVEEESIPEEMRDRMRTAVGQARLLMKERFGQFSGLVDDCELGRGDKVTTCSDLQGFWDMVYYQVEDVDKKFAALKEAESRNWVEELKPAAPRRKKVVKKPPTAAHEPAGASTAVKSRLAAAKAAMKAKKQAAEAEKAEKAAGITEEDDDVSLPQEAKPQSSEPQGPETVLFEGGFFQVESPAKLPGSTRRSVRLSSAVLSQSSPHRSLIKCTTPARAVTTPARATTTTPARATDTTPARAVTTTPARAVTTTPARAVTTTPARAVTPDNSVIEDVLGLDFERYLQPSERCSLSPGAIKMGSPVAEAGSGDLLPEEEALSTPAGLHAVSSLFTQQSKQAQAAESDLLLFTPDLRDRIRASVCPSDLMVFTPPNA